MGDHGYQRIVTGDSPDTDSILRCSTEDSEGNTLPSSSTSRLAVVTGGTRGIGRATAECLIEHGHSVLVTGTHEGAAVPEGCAFFAVNFEEPAQTAAFVAHLASIKPAILVNNAGVTRPEAFADIGLEEIERVHRINLTAPMQLCQAVIPGMRAQGWGRIVNVSSIWGVVSKAERATYSSTKGALNSMTRALAAEVSCEGILANCVAPGFIETDLLRSATTPADRQRLASQVPQKRLGQPEEVGRFIAWLCSDDNSYISGQTLVIDGGYTIV